MELQVQNVSHSYGGNQPALEDVSFCVRQGEFVAIVGPSGSGKSTLLSAIGGFLSPSRGVITVAGSLVSGPGADRVMIFQRSGLFPFYTVGENIEYGLKLQGVARHARKSRAREVLTLVGLPQYYSAYPRELSEGMGKLVEIARALVVNSRLLLFDEALGNLDALTRYRMQHVIEDVWLKNGTTILWVTHDLEEAAFLADRIICLSSAPGRIVGENEVDLPRPRQETARTSLRVQSLRADLFAKLQSSHLKVGRDAI
jgi:NitT/TauT family transport system ATP-binding protein